MSVTSSAPPRRGPALLGVAAVLAAAGALAGPVPAYGAAGCDGVVVVLDRGPLGGGAASECVPDGAGRSVADVTEDAGVTITWVQRYPGAFVCRLDGRPRDLPCVDTPPGDRYWGLFVRDSGTGSWTYASRGASSLTLSEGDTVGWRFQDGGELEPPSGAARPDGDSAADADESATSTGNDDTTDGGGSRVPTVVGLAMVAGLGAVGAVAARRRGR